MKKNKIPTSYKSTPAEISIRKKAVRLSGRTSTEIIHEAHLAIVAPELRVKELRNKVSMFVLRTSPATTPPSSTHDNEDGLLNPLRHDGGASLK